MRDVIVPQITELFHVTPQQRYSRRNKSVSTIISAAYLASEGWDVMKQDVAKHESEYTQEKCSWVAREWGKMVATMTPKTLR